MSLEVIDLKQRVKKYITDEGTFTLKPPYMYVVDELQKKFNKLTQLQEGVKKNLPDLQGEIPLEELTQKLEEKEAKDLSKKILQLEIEILKLLLEETGDGSLDNINDKTFRPDLFGMVVNDFFQQYGKLMNFPKV